MLVMINGMSMNRGIYMDKNLEFIQNEKINRTIKNLEKNNIEAFFAKDEKEVLMKLDEILKDDWVVAVGGSISLFECGVIDYLRSGRFKFLDRYQEGLDAEGIRKVFRNSFFADAYLTSTNALLETGELYNVDGSGNRTAAMLFGPDKVIVIAGINKIVKDMDEAIKRVRETAAPANCLRLSRKTPCTKAGHCKDCQSEERICNDYVLISRQNFKGRIKVIIVGKDLGY